MILAKSTSQKSSKYSVDYIILSLDARGQFSCSKSGDRQKMDGQKDYCSPLAHAQRVNNITFSLCMH